MLLVVLAAFFIPVVLSGIVWTRLRHPNRRGGSPYECGFDPKGSARTPFSLHFFLVALLFLIFDVEVTLLLPMLFLSEGPQVLATGLVLLMLHGSLMYEWREGRLDWVNARQC